MKKNYLTVTTMLMIFCCVLSACGHEHTWVAATCTEPKTCSECGATEGEPLGHDWEEATCIKPRTCKRCGYVEDDTLAEHVCENWTETVDATCTEEGYRKGKCKVCGKEIVETIAKKDHSFSAWEITKEASCQEKGERIRRCSVCGEEEKEIIEKLPHDLEEWEVVETPSYGKDGSYSQRCRNCGEIINTKPYTYSEFLSDKYALKGETEGFQVSDINFMKGKEYGTLETFVVVEITNTGDESLLLKDCDIDYLDDDGNLIGSIMGDYAKKVPKIINPGEKGYFLSGRSYERDEIDASNGIHEFANINITKTNDTMIRLETEKTSWNGSYPIVAIGKVTNNCDKDLDFPSIYVLYKNEDGRVINFGEGYLNSGIQAGETENFEAVSFLYSISNSKNIKDFEVIAFQ